MPEPCVRALLSSESISFLALMRLSLPLGLSDFPIRSNICLTLAV